MVIGNRLAVALAVCAFAFCSPMYGSAQVADQFEIAFPQSIHAEPVTGRIFVIITSTDKMEPRIQVLSEGIGAFDRERSKPLRRYARTKWAL